MTTASPSRSLLVGLTGGIGSGKSTIARMLLAHCAIAVIDADQLSRGLTASGGAAITAIAQAFGADFIDEAGALHRERMRAHVFQQPREKAKLERILHPMIFEAIERAIGSAHQQGYQAVVLDIPLLVESGHWRSRLDRILIVDCSIERQIQRVQQRSQLSEEEVRRIIQSQAPRAARLASADVVIYNESVDLLTLEGHTKAAAALLGLPERV